MIVGKTLRSLVLGGLLACGMTLGLGASPSTARAGDYGCCHYEKVVCYQTKCVPYQVCVTCYDYCGRPYHTYETHYREVEVAVVHWVCVHG